MSLPPVSFLPFDGSSVCLFCGASETADPSYTEAAYAFGKATAEAGWRLVYGGGGVGLMGASATPWHVRLCLNALAEASTISLNFISGKLSSCAKYISFHSAMSTSTLPICHCVANGSARVSLLPDSRTAETENPASNLTYCSI